MKLYKALTSVPSGYFVLPGTSLNCMVLWYQLTIRSFSKPFHNKSVGSMLMLKKLMLLCLFGIECSLQRIGLSVGLVMHCG